MTNPCELLKHVQLDLDLSNVDLWWRYFALGGNHSPIEVEAIMFGALTGTSASIDLLAAALNEESSRNGAGRPLVYIGRAPV